MATERSIDPKAGVLIDDGGRFSLRDRRHTVVLHAARLRSGEVVFRLADSDDVVDPIGAARVAVDLIHGRAPVGTRTGPTGRLRGTGCGGRPAARCLRPVRGRRPRARPTRRRDVGAPRRPRPRRDPIHAVAWDRPARPGAGRPRDAVPARADRVRRRSGGRGRRLLRQPRVHRGPGRHHRNRPRPGRPPAS